MVNNTELKVGMGITIVDPFLYHGSYFISIWRRLKNWISPRLISFNITKIYEENNTFDLIEEHHLYGLYRVKISDIDIRYICPDGFAMKWLSKGEHN